MGDCTICGKPAGFLRSKHAHCEAGPSEVDESSDAPLGASFETSALGAIGTKMGRPYELEASRITAVVEDVQALKREGKLEAAIQTLLPQLDL